MKKRGKYWKNLKSNCARNDARALKSELINPDAPLEEILSRYNKDSLVGIARARLIGETV